MGVLLESSSGRPAVKASMAQYEVKEINKAGSEIDKHNAIKLNISESQGTESSMNKENLTENFKNMDILDTNKVSKSKKKRMRKKRKSLAAHVSNLLDKKLRLDAKSENQRGEDLETRKPEEKSVEDKCNIYTNTNRSLETLDSDRIKMHIFDNYVKLEVDIRDKLQNDPNIRFEGDEFLVTVRSGHRRAMMRKTLPAGCTIGKTISYLNSDSYMVVKIPRTTDLHSV